MKVCPEPGCGTLTKGGRCQQHRRESPTYLQRDRAERARRARAVAEHRQQHGDWCLGYNCPPHPSTDLTADHVVPVAHGGIDSALIVRCRACNSRRGALGPLGAEADTPALSSGWKAPRSPQNRTTP